MTNIEDDLVQSQMNMPWQQSEQRKDTAAVKEANILSPLSSQPWPKNLNFEL